MGGPEQRDGVEVMKEMIQKEIQSIDSLKERVAFKELMEGVFLSLYETNLKMYEGLERRVKEDLDYDKNRYYIKTGIIEREFFDASHHLLFPMEERDLDGKLYDMKEILRAVTEEKCTIVWLLVPWAQDLLDAIDSGKVEMEHYLLEQWRLMHIGAQPVPPSLIQRWKKHFPHHQYDTNYGLSESIGPGCVHLGVENIHKVGAIGKPGYHWEAKIVDEQGHETARGDVGELIVHGPGVMLCYYKNPEATDEVLKEGWLYTGDMARRDEDGFYFLVDRKKDVIVSGGENIYPVQIEDFLRRFDKIKDAAVIGLTDKRLGEKTSAVIEIKDGMSCSKEEIEEFCMALPRYKRPKEIIFNEIPRNATGKIEKPRLRKMYGADCLVEKENMA